MGNACTFSGKCAVGGGSSAHFLLAEPRLAGKTLILLQFAVTYNINAAGARRGPAWHRQLLVAVAGGGRHLSIQPGRVISAVDHIAVMHSTT